MTHEYEVAELNRVRQLRELAHYDADSVHAILDAGLVAHVGFAEDGRPCVIPMLYGRDGECLYLHGPRRPASSGCSDLALRCA